MIVLFILNLQMVDNQTKKSLTGIIREYNDSNRPLELFAVGFFLQKLRVNHRSIWNRCIYEIV
jgi:hypothetical protein